MTLSEDWNLIGSISESGGFIDSSGIIIPNTLYTTDGISYQQVDTITPGKGYWIRASSPGDVIISSSSRIDSFFNYMEGANELIFNNSSSLYFGV